MYRIPSTAKALATLCDAQEIKNYLQSRMIAIFSNNMRLINCKWEKVGVHPNYNSFDGFTAKEWFMLRELALRAGLVDTGEDASVKVVNKITWADESGEYNLTYSTMNVFAGRGLLRTKHSMGCGFAPTRK